MTQNGSPGAGFRFTEKVLSKIYNTNGMSKAADESGAKLNFEIINKIERRPRKGAVVMAISFLGFVGVRAGCCDRAQPPIGFAVS